MGRIREIQPYIDIAGPEINPNFVRGVIEGAFDILSSRVALGFNAVRTLNISQEDITLDPFRVDDVIESFSHSHILLLTRRSLATESAPKGVGNKGVCLYGEDNFQSSLTIVSVSKNGYTDDFTLDTDIGTLVHETAHSFGLDHCQSNGCIMHGNHRPDDLVLMTRLGEPFCEDHANQLDRFNINL